MPRLEVGTAKVRDTGTDEARMRPRRRSSRPLALASPLGKFQGHLACHRQTWI